MACRSGSEPCSCIGRGNGARAGSPASSMNSWSSTASGRPVCPIPAKEPAGGTSSRRWSATGSSIRAANGVCTGCGSSKAPWAICSARISRWSRRTRSIVASTSSSRTKRRCSRIRQRWQDLFGARFDVLLYDLTSTYFESDPPDDDSDKRRHGYSRDKRPDCVQVVIALVVTPDGFPLAYEVLPGNTSDKTTLRAFLSKIEAQYGKAERIWVMDRGIPTEDVLTEMRQS